jgi:hypothetical protein
MQRPQPSRPWILSFSGSHLPVAAARSLGHLHLHSAAFKVTFKVSYRRLCSCHCDREIIAEPRLRSRLHLNQVADPMAVLENDQAAQSNSSGANRKETSSARRFPPLRLLGKGGNVDQCCDKPQQRVVFWPMSLSQESAQLNGRQSSS